MKPEQQVVSLDIAKRLKELGVKQESYFSWVGDEIWDKTMESDYETRNTPARSTWLAAFTVAELGEMLPKWYSSHLDVKAGDGDEGIGDVWICTPHDGDMERIEFTGAATEADARGKMLIYLLEKGLLKNNWADVWKKL